MAQNETVVAALEAQPVPPDRECVHNLSEILEGAVDYLTINTLASASAGSAFPSTNNIAQQALTKAQDALDMANSVNSRVKERRSSQVKIPLAAGDSIVPISWSPAMPSTLYEVRITLFGNDSPIASTNSPTWRVVSGSETVTSASINFGNVKTGMSFSWVVEEL